MIIYAVLVVFTIQRLQKLVYRLRPEMSVELQYDVFTQNDLFDLNDAGFKLAFGVMNYDSREVLSDDSRVQWNVFLEERKNLAIVRQIPLEVRVCTDEDYAEFFPVVG